MRRPLVFIAHAAKDIDRVLPLVNRLKQDAFDVFLGSDVPSVPDGDELGNAMWKRVRVADAALVVCTEDLSRRTREPFAAWEAVLAAFVQDRRAGKVIPVIFAPRDEIFIPPSLKGIAYCLLESDAGYERVREVIFRLAGVKAPPPSKGLPPFSKPDDLDIPQAVIEDLDLLASDSERLAVLLARMALNDRTRLDLAAAPTLAGFREALEQRKISRAELPALEVRLEKYTASFTPNVLWLSWVQTIHRRSLDAIQAEIRAWLPARATRAASVADAPQRAAPSAAKPPLRESEKTPIKKKFEKPPGKKK